MYIFDVTYKLPASLKPNSMNNNYEKNYDSYIKTKRKLFYWFSGFLVIISIVFIIPSLSNNLNDYDKNVEVFKSSRINVTERKKGFSSTKEYELIIKMQNGREWIFGKQYNEYWKEIGDSSNLRKTFTIYTQGLTDSNPSQIEIENKIIYDLRTLDTSKYWILILTFICSIFSVIDYRKYYKEKT
jgi:hypothetical protein